MWHAIKKSPTFSLDELDTMPEGYRSTLPAFADLCCCWEWCDEDIPAPINFLTNSCDPRWIVSLIGLVMDDFEGECVGEVIEWCEKWYSDGILPCLTCLRSFSSNPEDLPMSPVDSPPWRLWPLELELRGRSPPIVFPDPVVPLTP